MKNISEKIDSILSKIPHLIKRMLLILSLVYFGLGTVLFVLQAKYIYYPDETDFSDCPSFKKADHISFGSSRGYLTKRSQEEVVVYYHGNAGRACDRDYLDSFFAEQNYSTFFAEYSGYGEKNTNPSMSKLLKNVDDTIDFLKTQNFTNIIVVGESVGVGPAAYHTLHSNIDKLILITAYSNLADVASSHYPFYPMRLLLLNNFTPDVWLAHYKGEVSIILAESDEVISNKLGQKLYESIPSDLKKIYFVKNAGHNTIYEKNEFYALLENALK
ncbi:MAG: alpha/beta hydrolase [bacterium]|nr:alpha/beta hydrolase [bacterium]